ncbi:ROK family transcriptional regulator [Microbacterium kribbense]|uniref:ROK family transcriptional regulator n=1 Tax=Microbacterium kribbense TaxID=433645 RepID=A0ABP7G1F9_9MICO
MANLARLLRLVHLEGPLSRAVLTARTGLNRSTIGDLVAELAGAGLVLEQDPDPSGSVGRPSPLVAADPAVAVVAANPEVDALTVAAVGFDRRIRARVRIDRDELLSPDETADLVAAQVAQWREGELTGIRIIAAGLAVPGTVRAADGLVRIAPHLQWKDAAVGRLVEQATGLPTIVGNDANMGAVAEHLFGAARGADDVIYLNGGASGIGGGIIIDGMLVSGAGGYAGEFGQSRPAVSDPADRLSTGATLEDEVSRRRLLAAVGLHSGDEAGLASAMAASDAPALAEEIARQRRILATALANVVNALNPTVVVLGGFLATLAAQNLPELVADVRAQSVPSAWEGLEIRPATLADDRLLIGAAEAAFGALLRDPLAVIPR